MVDALLKAVAKPVTSILSSDFDRKHPDFVLYLVLGLLGAFLAIAVAPYV